MKTRVVVLTLAALALAGCQGGGATGGPETKAATDTKLTITNVSVGSDGQARVTAVGSNGKPVEVAKCLTLVRGANLASCLKGCNTEDIYEVSRDADYADLYHELELSALGIEGERNIKLGADAKLALGSASEALTVPAGSPCTLAVSGDACLSGLGQDIFSRDPIGAYANRLGEVVSVPNAVIQLGAERLGRLKQLGDLLAQVRRLAESKGIKGFARQGSFVARNIKNAPGLICQIQSQLQVGATGTDDSLRTALDENQKELLRSLDFLTRYQP